MSKYTSHEKIKPNHEAIDQIFSQQVQYIPRHKMPPTATISALVMMLHIFNPLSNAHHAPHALFGTETSVWIEYISSPVLSRRLLSTGNDIVPFDITPCINYLSDTALRIKKNCNLTSIPAKAFSAYNNLQVSTKNKCKRPVPNCCHLAEIFKCTFLS